MLAYLIQGLALGLPAMAQPGPFQAYLLSQSIKNGWRRTLPTAFAPLLSDGPIIVLVLLVLTRIDDVFLRGIQGVGGAFLLYLGWRAFETFRNGNFDAQEMNRSAPQNRVLEATLLNLLNPNPYLFWTFAGGPILLKAWRESVFLGAGFLFGFYSMLVGGFFLFIVLSATARRLGPGLSRTLTGISAVALLLLGAYQLWLAFFPTG